MTHITIHRDILENKRYHEIDVLKCVSILAVVYIHSLSTSFSPSNSIGIFFADLTRFAVPGLFFASGFLFNRSRLSTGQTVKKKVIRLLPPYIFCSLCIQFLNLPGLNVRLENLDVQQLAFNLVFGNTIGIYYFVFVLFCLYAFSLILRYIPGKWILIVWGSSFVLLLLYVKTFFWTGGSLFVMFRHPGFHLFSYLTGLVCALYYQKITPVFEKYSVAILITVIISDILLFSFTRMNEKSFQSFPILTQLHIYLCITLLLLIGIKTNRCQKITRLLSDYSYGIYLLHFPVVRSCQLLYPEIAADYSFPYAFISWSAGVSVSLFLIFAIKKITGRYSVHLVGC